MAGGVREGHELKFWTPGGSSTPIFTAEHLDVPLDYESVGAAGSMLGTRALQIFDETTSVVRAVTRWTEFYKHESCGKCTPCREGTYWLTQVLQRIEAGQGTLADIDLLLDLCDNILGKAFCALGRRRHQPDHVGRAVLPRRSSRPGRTRPRTCLFPPERSSLFSYTPKHTSRRGARMTILSSGPTTVPGPRRPGRRGRSRRATWSRSPSTASRPPCPRARWSSGPPSSWASRSRGSATTRCSRPAGACRQCLVEVWAPGRDGNAGQDAEAAGQLHARGHAGHAGQDAAHLARGRQGPARRHGAAAHQPPARLPGVRQGRRVPPAEPGDEQRSREHPVRRRQAHVPQADRHLDADPAGPRALHPVPALHPVLRGDRGRRVHRPAEARREPADRHVRHHGARLRGRGPAGRRRRGHLRVGRSRRTSPATPCRSARSAR